MGSEPRPSDLVWAARGEEPAGPVPGGPRPTVAQTARRIRDGEHWAYAVRELLDGLLLGGPIDDEEPVRVDRRVDAYLAALVEHISAARGVAAPAWVLAPDRFLDAFWWPAGNSALWASCLVQSPAAFRLRGIFIGATTLRRV